MAAKLQWIDLDMIDDHPKNPRVVMRQDVIDAIAACLIDDGFSEKHAIHVRPVGDRFQILSGHHRRRAAEQVRLDKVPCWVEEMDDDAAYMALATSNNQGELAQLEYGLHAVELPEASRGKGNKGSKRLDYASLIGKSKGYVSQGVGAAKVVCVVKKFTAVNNLMDKAKHLYAIYAASLPEDLWPCIVAAMVRQDWRIEDVDHWTGKVKEFDIPESCQGWIPLLQLVESYLANKEPSPQSVKHLIGERNAIMELVAANEEKIKEAGQDPAAYYKAAEEWLVEGAGNRSWDVRELVRYRRELEEKFNGIGVDQWLHGNWRDHVDKIKDDSVALFLSDPPYGMDYQSNYRKEKHEKIDNDAIGDGPKELADCMAAFFPKMQPDSHAFIFCHWRNEQEMRDAIEAAGFVVKGSLIWVKNNTGMGDLRGAFAPKHERIIHAVKGSPILFEREADVLEFDRAATDRHPTEKPTDLLQRLIEITTVEGQRVADPFGGVASTCQAAQEIERRYWGSEINETYYRAGLERIGE
jgi:site-specific DNA-methyltransferase (adenine-specific)